MIYNVDSLSARIDEVIAEFDLQRFRDVRCGALSSGEQTRVNDEVWLPRQWTIQAAGRILLVKGLRIEYRYTFSDYKKFSTDSRVVSTGDQ